MKKLLSVLKNWFVKSSLISKIIVVVVIAALGYFIVPKLFKSSIPKPQYQTATVTKGTIIQTVSASGNVSSANNTPIITQVTGAVTKLFVKNGDVVKVGQALATIQLDQDSQQKYIQALSSFQSAQNSLVSAKTNEKSLKAAMLTAEDTYLKTVLDKGKDPNTAVNTALRTTMKVAEDKYNAQTDVINQTQTSLTNASMNLRQVSTTITAPISGVITGLSLQVGSVIPAQAVSGSSSNQAISQNIANITTSTVPLVAIDLTEIDIPNVQIGQKATLTFNALPDKTYTGKVLSINTTGTVSSGVTTYPTTITLDTEAPQIYANMSASANIIIASKEDVLVIPSSALQTQNGETTVQVLKNGQVQSVIVTTGISSDTDTEIISGLNEGDVVVTAVTTASTTTGSTGASPFSSTRGIGGFGGGGGAARLGR